MMVAMRKIAIPGLPLLYGIAMGETKVIFTLTCISTCTFISQDKYCYISQASEQPYGWENVIV